jgi:hypothetical protein
MHTDAVHVRTTYTHGRHTPVAYLALEAELIWLVYRDDWVDS